MLRRVWRPALASIGLSIHLHDLCHTGNQLIAEAGARAHARQAGVSNVEFVRGRIEAIPLPDRSVDVIISNCVINLSTERPAVLAESFRVLRRRWRG